MNKILVLGGTHGNETLGVELVKLLRNKPMMGVDTLIANPRAVSAKCRYTESDLNRSFGLQFPGTYETKRARELRQTVKKYQIVLDFHNTMTPDNDSVFVGIGCSSRLHDVAKRLGLYECVEATYDCINASCPNVISIEISYGSFRDDASYWYKQIASLTSGGDIQEKDTLRHYRYLKRVTWQEAEQVNTAGWRAFEQLSPADKECLRVEGDIYPIFIGSRLTEYFATLIERTKEAE